MRFPVLTVFLFTLISPSFADIKSYTLDISNAFLSPDGFLRPMAVANGQFPGPLIAANKGDTLSVGLEFLFWMAVL